MDYQKPSEKLRRQVATSRRNSGVHKSSDPKSRYIDVEEQRSIVRDAQRAGDERQSSFKRYRE